MDNHVPALDTFLHEGGTGLAGDHVLARLEEDGGRRLGAHQALLAHLPPVVHVLAADQALFHALRATFAELRNNSYDARAQVWRVKLSLTKNILGEHILTMPI